MALARRDLLSVGGRLVYGMVVWWDVTVRVSLVSCIRMVWYILIVMCMVLSGIVYDVVRIW